MMIYFNFKGRMQFVTSPRVSDFVMLFLSRILVFSIATSLYILCLLHLSHSACCGEKFQICLLHLSVHIFHSMEFKNKPMLLDRRVVLRLFKKFRIIGS